MSHNIKVIAILGPTSSGKSDLAIRLARKFNGEIVSADSRQVYKGLDLGTGKVTKAEQRMACHHCLDIILPPKRWKGGVQPFTMEQYRRCADRAIQDIWSRGKIPLLVGGSQLYVRGVLYDYEMPPVPPDSEYRNQLEKRTLVQLQRQLYSIDASMRTWSDRDNKRRVIRALEIYHYTKKKPSLWYTRKAKKFRYQTLKLCIDVPREKLYARIDQRVDVRVRKGMIGEVERLRDEGVSKKWLRSLGLEYRFVSDYLDGVYSSKAEMLERLKYATHDFARRQLMWYRKENDITYVTSYAKAEHEVRRFLREKGSGTNSLREIEPDPN